jgi:hypothetical protein
LKTLFLLCALALPSGTCGAEEGPWRVKQNRETGHYSITAVEIDTLTVNENSVDPMWMDCEQAKDLAAALNEARERRTRIPTKIMMEDMGIYPSTSSPIDCEPQTIWPCGRPL